MRAALGVMAFGAVAFMIGCGDDVVSGPRTRAGSPNTAAGTETPPSGETATPAENACAAVKAPTALSDAKDAKDVRIAGSAVFFQSGPRVMRVLKDGTNKKEIFTSPDVVRTFVDKTTMILIETTANAPEATLRVVKATTAEPAIGAEDKPAAPEPAFPEFPLGKDGVAPGTAVATNYNAAGTRVFASDETSFYLLADTADGDAIIKVSKDAPATRTVIVQKANVISHPQLASGAIWYVRDQQRIFKVALADEENGIAQGEPTEVFGIGYASCNLAVTEQSAFCSVGSVVERRDLTGGNPTTFLDALTSKAAARFGAALSNNGALFVRSEQPDPKVKHVIRTATASGAVAGEETFVACGRATVTDLTVDAASVVWIEESTGVFVAPR